MVLKNNKIFSCINILGLLFSVLFPWQNNFSQDIPASSVGYLTFYMDHASFSGNDEKTHVEFYLMFYEDQITKEVNANSKRGEIKIKSVIKKDDGNTYSEQNWITEIDFTDDNSTSFGKVIYDLWTEQIIPGNYTIQIIAEDNLGNSKGEINKILHVDHFDALRWSASEMEFVSSIDTAQELSHFSKGNLKIIPNPSRRYGILIPKLYLYYEVYGINTESSELIVDYNILNQQNLINKELKNISVNIPGSTATIIHGIDVSDLKSGIYELKAIIRDPSQSEDILLSRRFEIIQEDFFFTKTSITEEQAEIFSTILSYIGTPQQLKLYRSLNLTGKAEFIVQYWRNLDPDPSTPENEYLIEIQKRFNHAKNNFGWYSVNGWETDRGRICIKYGIPHQINQFNTEANTAPYEIWVFNENRTYEFVFGDPRANGRYILLHSNRQGEIYNSNWRETIQRM